MISQNINVIDSDEELSIPLDISDIIYICKEFTKLGNNIQTQMEYLLEIGVHESIKQGYVKQESLPHIQDFLKKVKSNPYFGDCCSQAEECVSLIKEYLFLNKEKVVFN